MPYTHPPTRWRVALCTFALCLSHVAHAQPDYSPGQILVKFRNAKPALGPALSDHHGATRIEPLFAPRSAKAAHPHPLMGVYRVHLSGDPAVAAADYASRPDVVYAQPNHIFTHQSNDPRYDAQRSLQTLGWETLHQSLGPMKKQIVVAIIDSGIDYDHEDLRDNIWHNDAELRGTQGVDDDDNGYIDDIRGWDFTHAPGVPGAGDYLDRDNDPRGESPHGTLVAGIVAATTNNEVGIAGIAPDAQLMALRAGLNRIEGGGGSFLEEDDLAAAILYAVENGAHVINMSWGGEERTFVLSDILHYAHAMGVVLVSSAGNSSGPLAYPAAHHATLAIGATDHEDYLASFSNRGAALDLVAPGVRVLTTSLNNQYSAASGTSFSAPHVAGLAALILSRRPELSPQSVRGLLIASAVDLKEPWNYNRHGAGRVSGDSLAARLGTFDSLTVAILSPDNDQGASAAFDIRATVTGAQPTGYCLSYGLGHDPPKLTWTRLASGSPSASIRHAWDVSDFPQTAAVLRLEADLSDGGIIEDRVRVAIQKTGPAITNLVCGDVLEVDRRVFECRWETDQRAHGGMAYRMGADVDTIYTGLVQTKHRVVLPHTLPAGAVTYRIFADGENGTRTIEPGRAFDYVPFRIPQNGFSKIGTLPDGYLPDRASDFDRDGKPEIALMPYISGAPFGPVHIYELNGTFFDVFQTEERFTPQAIGDFNNDGRDDLLGGVSLLVPNRIHLPTVNDGRDDLLGGVSLGLRLLTGTAANPYPTRLAYEWRDLYGGQFADVDGDSIPDIIASAGTRRGIRVIRYVGGAIRDDFLPDPSPDGGRPGTRFVVADFDNNGHREILTGDEAGDLWMYEYRAGSYDQTWLEPGTGDARWIGGGADLDDDGVIEFAVARAYEDYTNPFNGFWELEIYSASANGFAREWAVRINGVAITGPGISTGDVDGDGLSDLLVCTPPQLYAFRADAPNRYRPFWHSPVGVTYRPLIADLDGDFRNEVLFNFDGTVHIVERDAPPASVPSPQIIRARALGPTRVELNWMPVPDASAYQIYRAVGREGALAYFDEIHDRTAYIDELLTEGENYRYQIVAIADADLRSGIVSLIPNARPEVVRCETLSDDQIQLFFSEAMSADAARPSAYLLAGMGQPTSVILDRQNTRAVLSFPTRLPTPYTLTILNASDVTGTPLGQTTITDIRDPSLLARADADGSGVIDFLDFLAFARAFQTPDPTFDFDGDGVVNFPDFLTFARLYGLSVNSKISSQ